MDVDLWNVQLVFDKLKINYICIQQVFDLTLIIKTE